MFRDSRKCTEIVLINVHPEWQRMGIGQELTEIGFQKSFQVQTTDWTRIVCANDIMRRRVCKFLRKKSFKYEEYDIPKQQEFWVRKR